MGAPEEREPPAAASSRATPPPAAANGRPVHPVAQPPVYPPPAYPPPPYPPPHPNAGAAAPVSPAPESPSSPVSPAGDNVAFLDVPGAPPDTRRSAGAWLVIAGAGFLVGQIGALVFVSVAAVLAGRTHDLAAIGRMAVPPEWYVVASLLGLWSGFFGAPWLASRVRGSGHLAADLGIRFRWIDFVGIAIGVGGQILVAILYAPFAKHLHNFGAPTQRLTGGSHGWGLLLIAVFTVVGAPFMEELFFRGLVFRALARLFTPRAPGRSRRRGAGVAAAVVTDGVLFGLAHGEWQQLAGLALFGMILALVSYRTGRLGMNMVAHATFNLVAVLSIVGNNGVVH